MFWAIMLILFAVIGCASWLAGSVINKRAIVRGRRPMSRQEQVQAAKLAGAFPVRKESRD
ncbi:MAG: hypothetical protein HY054_15560 [Proteobacteria bacterium]|nr:hypothetical protein [Pseudomonadota bacterium]